MSSMRRSPLSGGLGRRLRAEVMTWDQEMPDSDKPAAALRRTELLQQHFAKHRAALPALEIKPDAFEMPEMEKSVARYIDAEAVAAEAEEVMLQAFAKKADARQAAVIGLLQRLEQM
jgi:hypothetical protein